MTGYDFGDVVLVPFPFTDQSAVKRRPAVVVSSSTYHQARPDLLIGEHSINPFLSAPRPPLKSRTDHERPQTPDLHTSLFSIPCCAPHRHGSATDLSACGHARLHRDTVFGGAVATGVPHPLTGDRSSLRTVEPCGTASPDAVPQMRGCRSPSPSSDQKLSVLPLHFDRLHNGSCQVQLSPSPSRNFFQHALFLQHQYGLTGGGIRDLQDSFRSRN